MLKHTHRTSPIIACLISAIITGCGSGEESVTILASDNVLPTLSTPDNHVNVDTLIRTTNTAIATKEGNLLSNPSFETPLNENGWSACNNQNSLVRLIEERISGTFGLGVRAGDCVQQGVPVTPGDELKLQCYAFQRNALNFEWSGLGLSFYDSSWNYVSEPPATNVDDNHFSKYVVTATAPQGASNAAVWFYSEANSTIDNCSLAIGKNGEFPDVENPNNIAGYGPYIPPPFENENTIELNWNSYPFRVDGVIAPDGGEYNGGYANRVVQLIDGNLSVDGPPTFRIGHDNENLYIYITMNGLVTKDSIDHTGYIWDDDSFEIYFDLGNDSTAGYDDNDFVRIFGFGEYNPNTIDGINSRKNLSHNAVCKTGFYGVYACELSFNLAEMGLDGPDNAEFGFDIHWNHDSDGGTREGKFSWCGGNTVEAWQDMSTVQCSFIINKS